MTAQNNTFHKFYRSFSGKGALPLEPEDPYYVPRFGERPEDDPILALSERIRLAESESVHLLTGFRGNGKSTELKRLKKRLENHGCVVLLVDMIDYVVMTKPIYISDFTLSLMAALANAAEKSLPNEAFTPLRQNYLERLRNLLGTEVKFDAINLKMLSLADFALTLRTDETFKEKIQNSLRGHLTQLIKDARGFVSEIVCGIRERRSDTDLKVVLLVDSMEQLRGVGEDARRVYDSVADLFSGQAANLDYPMLHVVYTVPPYLRILSPNIGRTLGGNALTQWPNIHVRKKTGEPDCAGLDTMRLLVEKRSPEWEKVVPRNFLNDFAEKSGGDIRDFFRLLREAVLVASLMNDSDNKTVATLDEETVNRVIQQLKNEMLPIAKDDAKWLREINKSKQTSLQNVENLRDLARFFDSNLIMNYLNGEEWYDVHPALIEEIKIILQQDSTA